MCQLKPVPRAAIVTLGKRKVAPNTATALPPNKYVKTTETDSPSVEEKEEAVIENEITVCSEIPTISLIAAVRSGNLDQVKACVESENADVNETVLGCTGLHYAVFYNYKDIVDYLISIEVNLDVRNEGGNTPVAWAVERGFVDIAWALVDAAADPSIPDENSLTPLHKAVKLRNHDMVDTLLSVNTETEEWTKVNAKTSEGATPLYFACHLGDIRLVKALVEFGANVNLASNEGVTPLHRAVAGGHLEVVQFLIENSANVSAEDSARRTSVHLAIQAGSNEILSALLKHKPRIEGDSPLMTGLLKRAKQRQFAAIVQLVHEYCGLDQ